MSQIYVDNIRNRVGGAINAPSGINVTGVSTFSSNVSIAGTLTYEDVTNVDSVGVVTARAGVNVTGGSVVVGSAVTVNSTGINVVGVVTATSFVGNVTGAVTGNVTGTADLASGLTGMPSISVTNLNTEGRLSEKVNITAGKLSDNLDINIDNGNIHLFTTQETTTSTPNIVSNAGINTDLAVGDAISVTIVTTAAAAGYSAQLTIDGAAVTENWTGGSAPDEGGSSGVDIYAYTIMKTASATYTVVATQTKTS